MHTDQTVTMNYVILLPTTPGMNGTMYYIKCYVVWKTKYRWEKYKVSVIQHQNQQYRNDMITQTRQVLDFDWRWMVKIHIKRLEDTGKFRQ